MSQIRYFLSDEFNYDFMICSDAGPSYAAAYGWEIESLSTIMISDSRIRIIDNRITQNEFTILQKALNKSDGIFLLKVVDTYIQSREQAYIKFILSLKPQSNLFFLSPYQPMELGQELVDKHGLDKFVQIPYAYVISREVNVPLKKRKKRVIVSGNLAPEGYPFRYNFHRETYHKLWSLFKTSYLPHSGYPDIGMPLNHNYIGDNYIKLLGQYYFMLLCPGRLNFEFLKYSECAYSGCVPVGHKPFSFTKLPNELFFEVDESDIRGSVRKLFQIPYKNLELMANGYRQWMQQHRNPEYLNNLLISQINSKL